MPGQRITQLPPVTNILPTDFFILARGSTTYKTPGSLIGTKADVMALSSTFSAYALRTDLSRVSSSVVQLSTLTFQALQTVATKTELTTRIGGLSAQVDLRFALKTQLNSYILRPNTTDKPWGTVLTWDGDNNWYAGANLTTLSGNRTLDISPVGSIMWFSTPTAPQGYLFCDGRDLSVGTYPELFAVLGYRYGGSGITFKLPDLRGEFVRGWSDTKPSADPGRAFGSWQGDTFKSHSHSLTDNGHTHVLTDNGHTHVLTDNGHTHGASDSGHSHSLTDNGHSHTASDSGHTHGASDSGHNHAASDSGHTHHVNDPTHTHAMSQIENFNYIGVNRNTDRGGGGESSRAGALPYAATGITIATGAANISIGTGRANLSIGSGKANISIGGGAANISIATAKTNASIAGAKANATMAAANANISIESTGLAETRPRNMALLPCIKFTQLIATATLGNTLSSYIPKPTTVSPNQYLSYNGTEWIASNPLSLLPTGSQGQVLTWNNGSWTAGQGIAASIKESTAYIFTNQDTISWVQIPASAKRLTLVISNLIVGTESLNTIQLKLGTASGIIASGYQGVSTASYVPGSVPATGLDLYNSGTGTTNFPLIIQIPKSTGASLLPNTGTSQTGLDTIVTLMKSGTNRWVMSHSGRLGSSCSTQGGGNVVLSGPLTQVQLTTNNTAIKMTGGNALLYIE